LKDCATLDGERGWVWIGQQLYWTGDAGGNWREITPQSIGELDAAGFAAHGGGLVGWAVEVLGVLGISPSTLGWAITARLGWDRRAG
jgi:hypothetical protein